MGSMDWVREVEKEKGEYFKFVEGANVVQVLTPCAKLVQRWTGSKYEVVVSGDTQEGKSIKGVCYVLHSNEIKLAFLPYTVVKHLVDLQENPDWAFEDFPMNRTITITAKNAGKPEVEYSILPSPKESIVSRETLDALAKKQTPEQIVEAMKTKAEREQVSQRNQDGDNLEPRPEDVPF